MYFRKKLFRFSCVFSFLLVLLCIYAVRLVLIQTFRSSYLTELARRQHNQYITLEPRRGDIFDRHLRPLAVNTPAYSLYANPRRMTPEDKQKTVDELALRLGMDADFLSGRLNRHKYFVWLKRRLPVEVMQEIRALEIDGLNFVKENRRYYPNNFLAAHVLGFTDIDNKGLAGIEYLYNEKLRGQPGWARTLRDARQRELLINKDYYAPRDGYNLVLTIDETIQFIAERALEKTFVKYKARGASLIILDPKTGEVLALANRPTFPLSDAGKSLPENRSNRAVSRIFEPGSVFKIVTAAAALEEDVVTEKDIIFCENGEYKVANHVLHDHRPHGNLTFEDVIKFSSNIGTVKVAQKLGEKRLYRYIKQFQFGRRTNIDLPGELGGILRPPSQWSKTTISAIPMGHEIAVTPLQVVAAVAALANDGVYMRPRVVKYIIDRQEEIIEEFSSEIVDRIISEKTAQRVKMIMEEVVKEGTGQRAQIKGVRAAGKTGTAQKVIDGVYSHDHFYAVFAGFAPVEDPKLAMVVVVDDPRPVYYGGSVAAPVFQEVARDVLKYLEASESINTQTARQR